MRGYSEKIGFICYMVGFLVLACTLAFSQPLQDTPPFFTNPPDEHSRYLVPLYICEHGALPTGLEEELRIPSYGFSYGLYNVFPYIVQGCVMRLVNGIMEGGDNLLYVARLVNVFFGAAMALVVYLLGKILFADGRFRWPFCLAVTYFPQNIFIHSYVNTDSCCLLAVSMILYGLVSGYRNGMKTGSCIVLGSGMALCALSYYNAYGYLLSASVLFVAYFVQKKEGRLQWDVAGLRRKGILTAGIFVLGCGWWFVRSALVLDGDFLGLATRQRLSELYGTREVNPLYGCTYADKGYSLWQMLCREDFFEGAFTTFVAAYGSVSVFGSIWLYRAYKIYFGLGSIGILSKMVKEIKRRKSDMRVANKRPKKLRFRNKLFFHGNMLFCIIMPLILMIYYAYCVDYQNQGRYLLPSLLPLQYYMVLGVEFADDVLMKRMPFRYGKWLPVSVGMLAVVGAFYMVFLKAFPLYG